LIGFQTAEPDALENLDRPPVNNMGKTLGLKTTNLYHVKIEETPMVGAFEYKQAFSVEYEFLSSLMTLQKRFI
jgi:hypothetical protein